MKVLIIDDEQRYHDEHERLVKKIFGDSVEIHHKYDGENGSMFYEQNPDISIILTDNQMDYCDGAFMVKMIREQEERDGKGARVPIIMITGRLNHQSVQEAIDAGLNVALEKDVSEAELRRALEKVLLNRS